MSQIAVPFRVIYQEVLVSTFHLGDSQVIFKNTDHWFAAEFHLAPRRVGATPHHHEHLTESFYVVSGELWLQVGDREITAGPGSYVLVPPRTLHAFSNRSDHPVTMLLQASNPDHADFLRELYAMIQTSAEWPPSDPSALIALGLRYDTYYR